MSKNGTIAIRLIEHADQLLRFEINVTITGKEVETAPLSLQRVGRGSGRLAVIERVGKDAWKTKSPPAPIENGKGSLVVDLDEKPKEGATFFRWTVFVEVTAGHGMLALKHPHCKLVTSPLSAKQLNTPQPQKIVLAMGKFPRLVVGLNQAQVTASDAEIDPRLGTAAELRPVVEHVVHRLQGKHAKGDPLEPAWKVQKAEPLPSTLPSTAKVAHAEEAWARQVTEMLTLTPYAGTGLTYFGTFAHDGMFLADNLDGRDPKLDIYGLVHACQHLAAFGVSSRGRKPHVFGDFHKLSGLKGRRLVTAGSASALVVTDMKGTWVIGGKPPTPFTPKQLATGGVDPATLACTPELETAKGMYQINDMQGCDFAPGTVIVMANRKVRHDPKAVAKTGNGSRIEGKYEVTYKNHRPVQKWLIGKGDRLGDNTDGAHAGFVLRTDPNVLAGITPLDQARFQLLDTGGFGVAGRGDGVTVLNVGSGFHTGNFDGPDAKQISSRLPSMMRGIGVWPRMTPADGEALFDHVHGVLRKLRPLGLARLVILDRSKGKVHAKDLMNIGTPKGTWLLYASPVVPMYEAAAHANYSISRYVWSLRGVPAADLVEVRWFIFVPQRHLAQALIDAGRNADMVQVAEAAFDKITNPLHRRKLSKKDGSVDVAKVLAKYTLPILDLRSTPSGRAEVVYKYPKMANLSFLYHAQREGWDGKIRLPMHQTFMNGDETPAGFPGYVT